MRTNGAVALVALAGLVFSTAGAAAAENAPTVGAGVGGGFGYLPAAFTECGPPTSGIASASQTWSLTHTATYDSANAPAPGVPPVTVASFLGDTTTQIVIGPNVQGPQGAGPGGCGLPVFVPLPIAITSVLINGTAGTGSVHCDSVVQNTALYTRVLGVATFTFTVLCDITGNVAPFTGTVTDVPVRHVIEGIESPCGIPTPPIPPGFVANPQCANDSKADSALVTTFEAVGPEPL